MGHGTRRHRDGRPLTRLDGGASWDGYFLYDYSRINNIPNQTPLAPWWVDLFAPATNSDYVVTTTPLLGYDVINVVEYSSWLEDDPTYLFLIRRQGSAVLPPPPTLLPAGDTSGARHGLMTTDTPTSFRAAPAVVPN